jgi:hypothetical protein
MAERMIYAVLFCRFLRVSQAWIGCPDVGFAVVVRLVIV